MEPGPPRPNAVSRATASCGLGARHEQAEPALAGGLGCHFAHDAAATHHEYPIREQSDLVEIGRNQEGPDAACPEREQVCVDQLCRADIDASGRLAYHEHAGLALQLARHHQLLLIAARE